MFTVPDQEDAVAVCPPFSPPGPHPQGFFADCNPGQNFAGTRPIAEHFNELVLNLHALLTTASVSPAKGDATMLWRAILNLPIIRTARTLNVATTGTATPANPWGGDAFNSLPAALAFLDPYVVVPPGSVTINIAAGTYAHTAPITIQHPSGYSLRIVGAGAGATILTFPADCAGIQALEANVGRLRNLTVRGAGAGAGTIATQGVYCHGGVIELDTVTVENFRGIGVYVDCGTLVVTNTVTANDCGKNGFFIGSSTLAGTGAASTLAANRNLGDANIGISASAGGVFRYQTTGGVRGLWLNLAATIYADQVSVGSVSLATEAVVVSAHSALLCGNTPVANAWTVAAGQTFRADMMGMIVGNVALATANRAACSPAINTSGNIDSYIQAT